MTISSNLRCHIWGRGQKPLAFFVLLKEALLNQKEMWFSRAFGGEWGKRVLWLGFLLFKDGKLSWVLLCF